METEAETGGKRTPAQGRMPGAPRNRKRRGGPSPGAPGWSPAPDPCGHWAPPGQAPLSSLTTQPLQTCRSQEPQRAARDCQALTPSHRKRTVLCPRVGEASPGVRAWLCPARSCPIPDPVCRILSFYFQHFFFKYFYLFILAVLRGMQDLSSQARD